MVNGGGTASGTPGKLRDVAGVTTESASNLRIAVARPSDLEDHV